MAVANVMTAAQTMGQAVSHSSNGLPIAKAVSDVSDGKAKTSSDTSDLTLRGHASIAKDFDTFLKIMMTQMKYQDPMKPMDTTEMTQQIVSFAGIEQQLNTNKKLDALVRLQDQRSLMEAQGFMGNVVEVHSNIIHFDPAQGGADIHYLMPDQAVQASAVISDEFGRVVRVLPLSSGAGKFNYVWDGKDATESLVEKGNYQVRILAKDKDGADLSVPTFVRGRVEGFERTESGEVFLSDGQLSFPIKNVVAMESTPVRVVSDTASSMVKQAEEMASAVQQKPSLILDEMLLADD